MNFAWTYLTVNLNVQIASEFPFFVPFLVPFRVNAVLPFQFGISVCVHVSKNQTCKLNIVGIMQGSEKARICSEHQSRKNLCRAGKISQKEFTNCKEFTNFVKAEAERLRTAEAFRRTLFLNFYTLNLQK